MQLLLLRLREINEQVESDTQAGVVRPKLATRARKRPHADRFVYYDD